MKHRSRTPLFVSSWYIGAGNLISSFTWRAKRPYSKIKEIYGDKLNNYHSNKISNLPKELNPKEKIRIKEEIKREIKEENRRLILISAISIVFTVTFLWLLGYFIRVYYF